MNENMIYRLALCVYSMAENSYDFTDEGFGYDEVCDLMGLDPDEKVAVLAVIDEDLRIV